MFQTKWLPDLPDGAAPNEMTPRLWGSAVTQDDSNPGKELVLY